jgi:hypothetical protein
MSALINYQHIGSSTIVDTNMSPLGNSNVTKSQDVAVKPSAAVVPPNTDKGTECL